MSDLPLQLEYDQMYRRDILPLNVHMLKKGYRFSAPFSIRFHDKNGVPVSNETLKLRMVGPYQPKLKDIPGVYVTTDGSGCVTQWCEMEGFVYFDLMKFQIMEGYGL